MCFAKSGECPEPPEKSCDVLRLCLRRDIIRPPSLLGVDKIEIPKAPSSRSSGATSSLLGALVIKLPSSTESAAISAEVSSILVRPSQYCAGRSSFIHACRAAFVVSGSTSPLPRATKTGADLLTERPLPRPFSMAVISRLLLVSKLLLCVDVDSSPCPVLDLL